MVSVGSCAGRGVNQAGPELLSGLKQREWASLLIANPALLLPSIILVPKEGITQAFPSLGV